MAKQWWARLVVSLAAVIILVAGCAHAARAQQQSTLFLDLGDGYTATQVYEYDAGGVPRFYTNVLFPAYMNEADEQWTDGVRTALVKIVGCEAFEDCHPRLMICDDGYHFATPCAELKGGGAAYAYRLVRSLDDRRTVGASFLIFR
jgi:hypothetical protein